jgi:aldehyde:ferredoxin oxidoreductase
MHDPLPEGPAQGMVIERNTLEMMKDAYYDCRGWDRATGIPTPQTLRDLALDDLIEDLWGN